MDDKNRLNDGEKPATPSREPLLLKTWHPAIGVPGLVRYRLKIRLKRR